MSRCKVFTMTSEGRETGVAKHSWFGGFLARVVVPGYIAAGAVMKFLTGSPADLPDVVRRLAGTDAASLYQVFLMVVCTELVLAALLVMHRRWASVLAALSLTVFCVVLVIQIAQGGTSCGCFGAVKVSPWAMLGIDAVLLALVVIFRRKPLAPDISSWRWVWITMVSAGLIVAVFGAERRGWQGRYSGTYTLDTHTWMGRSWETLNVFNFTPSAPDGRTYSPATFTEDRQVWVFYRRTCPHCHETIKKLAEQKASEAVKSRLVVVDLPYEAGVEERYGMTPREAPCEDCTKLRAVDGTGYTATVPVVVTFVRGVVTDVRVGN